MLPWKPCDSQFLREKIIFRRWYDRKSDKERNEGFLAENKDIATMVCSARLVLRNNYEKKIFGNHTQT